MNTENFDLRLDHYNIMMVEGKSYDYYLTDWNGKYRCRIFISPYQFVEGFETNIIDAIKHAVEKIK